MPAELRQKASDALLRPEQARTYDDELPSFKTLLNRAIQSCGVDLRREICSNVLLIGEFADIEGKQCVVEKHFSKNRSPHSLVRVPLKSRSISAEFVK